MAGGVGGEAHIGYPLRQLCGPPGSNPLRWPRRIAVIEPLVHQIQQLVGEAEGHLQLGKRTMKSFTSRDAARRRRPGPGCKEPWGTA